MVYIPATRPTSSGSFSPAPILYKNRCHSSCSKHMQLAMILLACSYRSAETLASRNLACKAVCYGLWCGETVKSGLVRRERRGNKQPLFFSDHSSLQFYTLDSSCSVSPYSSLSVSSCQWDAAFHLDFYCANANWGEVNFPQHHLHFTSFILHTKMII